MCPRIEGWLIEDAGLLSVLNGLQRAARDWAANGEAGVWLTHAGERLTAAEQLAARQDLATHLQQTDQAYLAACRTAERAARRTARRVKGLMAMLVIGIIGGLIGWMNQAYLSEQIFWLSSNRPH